MKTIRFSSLLLLIISLFPIKGFSWGAEGHRITASIAYQQLNPAIRDSLKFYLGTISLEQASTWMDEVRSDHKYDVLKPFHYINIEKGEKYVPYEGNIISELNHEIAQLKNRKTLTKAEIAIDLKILIHLLGDLHQPLHCGYGIDRGGNNIQVGYLDIETNLHKVWDSEIIKSNKMTAEDCLKLMGGYSKADIDKIKSGDAVSWMIESRSRLDEVYNFQNGNIDQVYIDNNGSLIEKQLVLSGLRIAEMLEEIFLQK